MNLLLIQYFGIEEDFVLKKVSCFFKWLGIFKFFLSFDFIDHGNERVLNYAFSQSNIFQHACATPLTVLMSNIEEDLRENKEIKNTKRLKGSFQAIKRLTNIIKFTEEKDGDNKKFKVCDSINEVIFLLGSRISNNCILNKIFLTKNLFLFGNKLYFQEALLCVLNNSLEAYKKEEKKPVSIIVRKVGELLKIDIVDYAGGMNFFTQKLVLLNGVSTKKNGRGLGLSFVKKTVEEVFSGKIFIKSNINIGTHITMMFPLKKPYNQILV